MDITASHKLLSEDTLRTILKNLPLETVLVFRESAKTVHHKQLEIINDVLKEKGYVEPYLEAPEHGYHD